MLKVARVHPDALAFDAVCALYDAVGWTAYTRAPDRLRRALSGSTRVAAAWADDALVGLARSVGDEATICFVQDVLVHPAHQGQGLGARLFAEVAGPEGARVALLTDGDPRQRAFYARLGLSPLEDTPLVAYLRV